MFPALSQDAVLFGWAFRLVLDAFAKVTPDRRCYRMVGGVLVERSVAEVRPVLEDHKQKVSLLGVSSGCGPSSSRPEGVGCASWSEREK